MEKELQEQKDRIIQLNESINEGRSLSKIFKKKGLKNAVDSDVNNVKNEPSDDGDMKKKLFGALHKADVKKETKEQENHTTLKVLPSPYLATPAVRGR